uniref:Uncharacterized protein n=1 Tax=Caudovirales sp. ctrNG92 TaxID=2827638 RepID=A0A8S5SEM2_9CAUD|nr:MAG TPA: hypothetical protein [Caudovirales sp. ctrNG92]
MGRAVKGEIKQKAGTNPAFCCTGNTAVSFELRARKSLPITRTRVSNARSSDSYAARLLTQIIIIHAGGAVKGEIKQKAGTNPAFCCTGNTAVSFELRARKSLPITRTRVSNARSSHSCAARLLTWIIIIHAG